MSADTIVTYRQGEKSPEFVASTTDSGTLLISGTPTFQLIAVNTGLPVNNTAGGGTNFTTPVSVTGYDQTAASSVRCWYNLLNTDTALLDDGDWFIGKFTYTVVPSGDGISRIEIGEVLTRITS